MWENPSKRSRLELLLKQLEELIFEEGLDESQSIGEAEVTQEPSQPIANSSLGSSLESERDTLESRKDVTEQLTSESPPPLEETAELPDERETPSSELLDEIQPDAQEEPTQKGSELTDELLAKPLTHAELVERLKVKPSTLRDARKRPNFSEWSKSKDPEGMAWQWVPEHNSFVPLKN